MRDEERRRRLSKVRKREANFRRNENHRISKQVVAKAKATDSGVRQSSEQKVGLSPARPFLEILVRHFPPKSCAFGHERRNHCAFPVLGYPVVS